MAVPKTKAELLNQSQQNYSRLMDLVNSIPEENQMQEFPFGTMNRNIRDVLAHLHHWHLLFLNWYQEGMQGAKPAMPAPGYTWKNTKDLNREIWQHYQDYKLEKIKQLLAGSHAKLQGIIAVHPEEELVTKKLFPWTGTSSLATYLRANTSSHYYWGINLIKKAFRP